jgi:anthranilate synthase component II
MQKIIQNSKPKRSKKVLIIDNFDSFTFNLVDFFRVANANVEIFRNNVKLTEITKFKPELLVFSPGPGIPKNAGNLLQIIENFHQTVPIFGVCLGFEALIEFFGGTLKFVTPVHGKNSEIKHDGKTIFSDLPKKFKAGRYHSLAADFVPKCFEISARGENLIMGIRHKSLPIEAVQFHPESVLTMRDNCGLRMIENLISRP